MQGGLQGLRGHTQRCEQSARPAGAVRGEREEHVLGVDVGRAERACELVRLEQRGPDGAAEHRRGRAGCGARLRESFVDGRDDRGGVGPGAGHDGPGGVLLRHDAEDVQRIEVGVAAFGGEACGSGHEVLRAAAEETGDVDAARATRPEE